MVKIIFLQKIIYSTNKLAYNLIICDKCYNSAVKFVSQTSKKSKVVLYLRVEGVDCSKDNNDLNEKLELRRNG